jgi:hypothetical protein
MHRHESCVQSAENKNGSAKVLYAHAFFHVMSCREEEKKMQKNAEEVV